VRDDKSDGEVVYTAADGEIDGWRLMNDDYVYIYDDGEGYLYNVNTDEKITIKSGCKWFEDVFGISL
jgi:hypothetical protein